MIPGSARRVLILTPRLDGTDGISEVSRQAVDACADVIGADVVDVWAFEGSETESAVRSAAGRRSRLARWSLAEAMHRADDLLLFVLHVHLLPVALPLVMRGARLACFLHGVEAWRPLRSRERATLSYATTILANSQFTANRFREANPGAARVDIAICPLGVGPAPSPERPPFDGYALIVGRLATDERYKGHELLIEIWPDVLRRVPSARLVIVGDGDDRTRLERLAADRRVSTHITFTGRVSDAQREGYYQNAAFFVMPSTGEGFGLAYLEAMRAGKACIAVAGAANEIIEDGTTGVIVDPLSAWGLRDAIVRLFTDRALTCRMGEAATDRVAHRFGRRRFADTLVAGLGLAAHGSIAT